VVAIGLLVVQLLLLSRPSRLAVAVALGVLPLLLPAHLALWHHRAEPEYRKVLPVAFAWGASLAVLVSAALNNASSWLWGPLFGMLVAAPLFEEVAKAAVLFVLFQSQLLGRRPVRDGIVTAIMVGLGFALTENALYYGTTLATIGTANLAELFPLRAALSPLRPFALQLHGGCWPRPVAEVLWRHPCGGESCRLVDRNSAAHRMELGGRYRFRTAGALPARGRAAVCRHAVLAVSAAGNDGHCGAESAMRGRRVLKKGGQARRRLPPATESQRWEEDSPEIVRVDVHRQSGDRLETLGTHRSHPFLVLQHPLDEQERLLDNLQPVAARTVGACTMTLAIPVSSSSVRKTKPFCRARPLPRDDGTRHAHAPSVPLGRQI
jgi:hypothetical protein